MSTPSKAVLRSTVGNHELTTSIYKKQVKFVWDAGNNFEQEVPIYWSVFTPSGNEIVRSQNYAQEILNSYPGQFEFVRYVTDELVKAAPQKAGAAPKFVLPEPDEVNTAKAEVAVAPEPVSPEPAKKTKKEKQNEAV